ncbi:GGDEF domain-containing protein [Blastococcus sp. TF02A-35]|uniref:putative bifunctional diguanylate cyclase/phosphodiesterase n=1 Tax=Blastococcus sp. TF02A-35 TaxID=2559612 RepID=UPI001073F083|nr:GGDEF domain-containing protein [Blastococcus sp. TF02A_35]TFV46833.1 GGDEF domain-containing protein [Blastococcus sp. TF02A_35]
MTPRVRSRGVPGRPAPVLPAGRDPRARRESAAALTALGVLGMVAVALRVALGSGTSPAFPLVLAVESVLAGVVVTRHASRLDARSRRPWRALGAVAGLLTVAELVYLVDPAGSRSVLAQVPQVLAVPLGIAACLLLMPSRAGRRPGVRELLDGGIVLVAVALVGVLVLDEAAAGTRDLVDALMVVGYPVTGALVCGMGLMAVSRAGRSRRRAAVWLLATMTSFAVVAVAGAMANVLGAEASHVLTLLAWTAMLAAAVRAVDADPGALVAGTEEESGPAMFGVVAGQATAYGVAGVVVVMLGAGHTFSVLEQVMVALVVLQTSARGLLWAADGRRLTRRMERTEAYFRALAASAEDVTVVLDDDGRVRWVSGPAHGQLGWPARDLTDRVLADLVDPADHAVLAAALDTVAAPAAVPPVVRLRAREGDWRDVELSGAARAGVPGTALREGLVLHLRDVTARRSTQRELERMAFTDYLTGLPNRARFMAELDDAHTRAAAGDKVCVLLVDLDGFRAVNDVAGHDAGDRLLCQVADQLRQRAREQDLVARLGGDEFALLVPGDLDEATGLAERLVVALDRSFRAPGPADDGTGPVFAVSGSIGVARLDAGQPTTAAVRQADVALRAAKAAGKRCVRSSGEGIDDALGRRTRLARDLPLALEQGQLRVVYQPVVGVEDRRVLGLEALVRWEHPLLGTVGPEDFIPIAEDDGLIVPLERWVLKTATADAARLLADGRDVQVGVNVSMRHLQAGCLAPDVAQALAAAGLPPGKLVLELTESVMIDQQARLESDLATLRGMGCVLALDDFGRGYSSLAYLARLPVHILKMDREFIADIETDPRGRALVAAVVELGRTLGMDVIAEGVETDGQLAELRAMDCRFLQGYLFGRPMPLAELRAMLQDFDASVLDGALADLDTDVHLVGQGG